LAGYYLTYRLGGKEPPQDAILALESAYELAPFDTGNRRLLAHQLLLEKRDADAMTVLGPIIHSPHSNKRLKSLRALVAKFERGERQPLVDELAPKLGEDKDAGA
jgi:hypothetical protein